MFELKITTETAAEARQALEQVMGIQAYIGKVSPMFEGTTPEADFDQAVEKRVAEIDARVKTEILEMHDENKAQAARILQLEALLRAADPAAAIEKKLKQYAEPDSKEVKRSHKAKPKAADPEETAAQVIQGSPTVTAEEAAAVGPAEAPPWIPEAQTWTAGGPLEDPVPAAAPIEPAKVRLALADLAEAKGRAALEKILADFQAKSFSKLDPDRYAEVLQATAEAMR